jgi:surface protein
VELYDAVDAYLAQIGTTDAMDTSDVAVRYGYPIGQWDISRLTHLDRVFDPMRRQALAYDRLAPQPPSTFNEDLSGWDTTNVISMAGIFSFCTAFTGRGLEKWNVAKVTNFSYAFAWAFAFNGNISQWDTSSAVTMDSMFYFAQSFAQDVSLFNVTNVESMVSMFEYATEFRGGDLEQWNVAKVVDMNSMFAHAESFRGFISTWDTSRSRDMGFMVRGCCPFEYAENAMMPARLTSLCSSFIPLPCLTVIYQFGM